MLVNVISTVTFDLAELNLVMGALETCEASNPSRIICFEIRSAYQASNCQSHVIWLNEALLRHFCVPNYDFYLISGQFDGFVDI